MYFPDLSCYGYRALKNANKYLNVGWLDEHHSFPTGTSDEDTLRKLFKLCQSPVAQTRGWHPCPFCKTYPTNATLDGQELHLGSAEIEVSDPSGTVFAAPDLIYHYIAAHKYKPPNVFIVAVESR